MFSLTILANIKWLVFKYYFFIFEMAEKRRPLFFGKITKNVGIVCAQFVRVHVLFYLWVQEAEFSFLFFLVD